MPQSRSEEGKKTASWLGSEPRENDCSPPPVPRAIIPFPSSLLCRRSARRPTVQTLSQQSREEEGYNFRKTIIALWPVCSKGSKGGRIAGRQLPSSSSSSSPPPHIPSCPISLLNLSVRPPLSPPCESGPIVLMTDPQGRREEDLNNPSCSHCNISYRHES